jgi:ABC-type glycerol-3-phosphate transport system substrate-binding protein
MYMKRLQIVLTVIVMLAFIASCAPQAPAAAKMPQKMRVWITWGDNPAQLQDLFNKFGAANGIQIEVNAPVDPDKVDAALSGTEPPDVLILGGPDNVGTWAREKLILPLDDYMAGANIDKSDFYGAPLAMCQTLGKYYCLPWGTDIYALYWNKDMFEAAGLDPEKPPETMEQLAEYADKLTKKDTSGELTQVGFIPDFAWGHTDLYLAMFGSKIYSPDGTKVNVDTPEYAAMLKWEQQFYSKYGYDKVLKLSSAGGNYMSPDQGFYAGKIAMYVDGEWQPGPNFISKFKPELNYGVAPFPPPADHPERKNTAAVAGTVAVIPSGAANKAASAKLLAWMETPDIVAEEMSTNFNLPTSKKAANDPRFHTSQKFEVFLGLISDKNATYTLTSPVGIELSTELDSIAEQVVHNGQDPGPLLKAAQAKIQPLLDKALTGQ